MLCWKTVTPLIQTLAEASLIKMESFLKNNGMERVPIVLVTDVEQEITLGANHTLATGMKNNSIQQEFIRHFGMFGCKKFQLASPHCNALDGDGMLPCLIVSMLSDTRTPKNCVAELVLDYSVAKPFKWPLMLLPPNKPKSHIVGENKLIYKLLSADLTEFEVSCILIIRISAKTSLKKWFI